MSKRSAISPLLLLLPLGACAVGPDFHAPPPPATTAYVPVDQPSSVGDAATGLEHLNPGQTVPERWWTLFGSPAIDRLVAQALAANTDLKMAEAALRQAREQSAAAAGALFPQVDAHYQAERDRTSGALANVLADNDTYLYTLHTAQLSISYPLDLFGGERRKAESARAAAQAQFYRTQAARQTVIANTVLAAIQEAALRGQLEAARQSVAVNRQMLDLVQKRQALGDAGAADVAAQQTALAQAEGAVPPLEKALVHQQAALSVLIGREPALPLPATVELDQLALPAELPLSLPSELVLRRPDIRAAEAQLHGASADVGVAIAARLPSIMLTANAGGMAPSFSDMFKSGNPFWSIVGGLTQPLFHGGTLRHQQRAAQAALEGAKAQYRGAVLQAFVDVSDALTALRTDADALSAAMRADAAAKLNLRFVRRQAELGQAGSFAMLNATSASAQASVQLIQARAARYGDVVALMQALGGGTADGPAALPR